MSLQKLVFACMYYFAFAITSVAGAGELTGTIVVNSYTPGGQGIAKLVSGSNGGKLILWADVTQGATWVQRASSSGVLSNDKYLVKKGAFTLASGSAGSFAVLASGVDNLGGGTFATIYDRNGAIMVDSIRLNNSTSINGSVAMDSLGNFVVAYTEFKNPKWTISIKRFNANGIMLGAEIPVAESTTSLLAHSGFDIDGLGNVTISWLNITASSPDIWMRRFNSAGASLGEASLVHTYTAGPQSGGDIAMSKSSGFVISWNTLNQDGIGWSIYAQRYAANGAKLGGAIRLSPLLFAGEPQATVAMADDGSFVASWTTEVKEADGSYRPIIFARQVKNDGTLYLNEFEVSSTPSVRRKSPAITMDMAGNYMIGWTRFLDSDNYDAEVKSFQMDTMPIATSLVNNQAILGMSGITGSWRFFKISTPVGATRLKFSISGGIGDADLYVRFGAYPTSAKWDARPFATGNIETVDISNPPAGDWYVAVNSYATYSSLSLTASYW